MSETREQPGQDVALSTPERLQHGWHETPRTDEATGFTPGTQNRTGLLQGLKDRYLWLVIVLGAIATGPLLQPGYFWGAHDARHSVYFLFEFNRAIQDGVWYPRWAPDFTFGYGYPFFNIYGPLAFYVGEAVHTLGLDLVDSTKVVFGLSLILSGLAMFLFVRRLMGSKAAFIAGLMYVYVPYHIADVYVRAALSESFGLIFLPLVLWGFYETVQQPRLLAVIGTGLAFAAMMLTTQLLTMLSAPLIAVFVLILIVARVLESQPIRTWSRDSVVSLLAQAIHVALPPLLGGLLGLGLSGIFWLPALTEYKYVRVDQWVGGYYDYREQFINFFQLFSPKWGFGTSVPGAHDDFGFQLGAVPLTLAVLSLLVRGRIASSAVRRLMTLFQIVVVVVAALMLAPSIPIWDALKLVSFAQFPWRLLIFEVLALAFLAGAVVAGEPGGSRSGSGADHDPSTGIGSLPLIVLVTLIIVGSYPYLQAQIVEPAEGPVGLAGLMRFQQSAGEMTGSTAWVQEIPKWSAIADHYIAGLDVASKIDFTASEETLEAVPVEVGTFYELVKYKIFTEPGRLVFDIFYYPGWHAYLMKKDSVGYSVVQELKIEPYGKLGKISVEVGSDRRFVLVRFEDTPVRVIGKWLSLASLALVMALIAARTVARRRA